MKQLRSIIFLLLAVPASFLSQVVVLSDTGAMRPLGRSLSLLEDSSGVLSIREVSGPEYGSAFRRGIAEIPNYNVTRSTIWSRVTFYNRSSYTRWYLECRNPNVSSVDVYVSAGNGSFTLMSSGFRLIPEMRPVAVHGLVFPLDIQVGDSLTCYVAMRDILPLQVHLAIGNPDRLFESFESMDLLHGAFFGLLLMLVIYNLFIYISVKDKVYLYYVFYVIANAWFISFLTGYGIHVPGAAYVLQHHPALVPYFLGAAACLFSIVFLDMKRTFLRGYRITMFMFFLLLTVPALDLAGFKVESILLVQLYGLSFSIISFIFGWIVYRRGFTSAKFYILGWTAYLVGLIMHISTDLKLLPFNSFTHNSLEIFTAVEAVLLSMAVGDKISIFKKEKEAAQKQALASAMKNEQLVREQNVVLAERVKERTHELEEQKKIVEEKNKEIVDSINYARRIQYTLLAHADLLQKNLPGHFVLFMPKDIVSGDFYWAAEKGGSFFLAVCDSTGHGVPGAFMSLLNISYLNEAVIEKNILAPDRVFDHVRRKLIENLSQYGGQDGMDGVLLRMDRASGKIDYAAAHNSVLLVSNGACTALEADKMPIGKGVRSDAFALRTVNAKKGDMIYLYTDGLADQFGGPKGKKFKYRQLEELLLKNAGKPPEEQRSLLEAAFLEWKGRLEQVDDVCVIGISF